jgi:hypothetical protein
MTPLGTKRKILTSGMDSWPEGTGLSSALKVVQIAMSEGLKFLSGATLKSLNPTDKTV